MRALGLLLLEGLKIGGNGELNLFDHFFADAGNRRQLLGRHVGQFFDAGDAMGFDLFDGLGTDACQFRERRSRAP